MAQERININKLEPEAYTGMYALGKYNTESSINPIHKELIKIRASQINGCAYCIDLHTKDARKLGETEQRIYALNAWRDTPFFSEMERVILAMTEEITRISEKGLSEETYAQAAKVLDEHTIAQVIVAIITINAWNRIAISTKMQPGL